MKDTKMKELKIKLPKSQKDKFEAIKWLTDPMGPRGSGRTYLLALCFIMHSFNYRIWVTIYDHSNHPMAKQEMIRQVVDIINTMKGIKLCFRGRNRSNTEILVTTEKEAVYQEMIFTDES